VTGTADIEARWPGIGLHELFEAQARRTPAAPAVIADDEVISYSELDGQANRLAHHLLEQGAGVESRVAVCMRRSPALVVTLLAVLKAGAVYVPLDPAYPAERAVLMLTDSAATLLVTDASATSRPVPDHVRVVPYALDVTQNEPTTKPQTVLDSGNLAYVFFTSGSTGQPKAVMVSHRAIRNHTVWFQETFRLGERDRLLHKTPIGFDPSVTEFMAPLIAGAQLVLAPDHVHRDPASLVNTLIDREITVLQVVPTLLALLLDQRRLPECRSLRLLVCGGEALPTDLIVRARALLPARVHNLYGPTETAIDVTWLDATEPTDGHVAPIGRPITGTRVHVLDADLRPVPPGETGELYIGGVALARGYLGRPDLTAERFVPDPFAASSRLYRTGDLGRYLPDGAVEFAGRVDQQLKIHGVRVEPGEIEALLREHPAVDDAAVVAQAGPTGDDRLVAYVAAGDPDSRELPDEIRAYLADRLPSYLVPAAVNVHDALPRTGSGKLDRRALSACQDEAGTLVTAEFAAPRTPLEKEIADAFAGMLGVERIGINDRLFDQGADSLTVARLGTHVMNTYNVDLPLFLLFSVATVAGVAETVESYALYGDEKAATRNTSMISAEAELNPDLVPDWKDE
jgi:amino acid adenylation domain-containing protein